MFNSSQAPSNPVVSDYSRPSAAADASLGSSPPNFVCVGSALRRLLLQAEIAAPRLQVASIDGEPGTGKHLFAQTLHRQSSLAALPFRRRDAREWLATDADPAWLTGTLYLGRAAFASSEHRG